MATDSDFDIFDVIDLRPAEEDQGVIFHAVKVDEDKWVQIAQNPTAKVGSEVMRAKPEFNTFEELADIGYGEYDAIDEAMIKAYSEQMEAVLASGGNLED